MQASLKLLSCHWMKSIHFSYWQIAERKFHLSISDTILPYVNKKKSIISTKCQRIVCNCTQKKSIIYSSSINSHKCSQFSLQCESKIRITKCKNNTKQKNRENHHFKLICTTSKQLTKALIKICTELCVSVCAVMCCALA